MKILEMGREKKDREGLLTPDKSEKATFVTRKKRKLPHHTDISNSKMELRG